MRPIVLACWLVWSLPLAGCSNGTEITSSNPSADLSSLSSDDKTELCAEMQSAYEILTAPANLCKLYAVGFLESVAACQQVEDACPSHPPKVAKFSTTMCLEELGAISTSCSSTAGDLIACVNESLDSLEALSCSAPDAPSPLCDKLTSACKDANHLFDTLFDLP